jgi:polysaccharide deacetylase family protein (PEP-CTERM system associated)
MASPATLCNGLSVDVEDYFQVAAFAQQISPAHWGGFQSRVRRNTHRLLEMFDRANVKGTFFVLGWVGERNRELVSEIHTAGHEVACHGYSHELVYRQTVAIFREETRRAKGILEDIVQVPVEGYRAASYSIVPKTRWALDVLAEEGFTYYSSIYPIRHDLYGMPDAPLRPHRLTTPKGRSLAEFPPTAIEIMGARLPVGGGGYFRLYPYTLTAQLLKSLNRREVPFMFYVHPWEIDPGQPRIPSGAISRFRHYVNLQHTEARLRRLISTFPFAPVRDVLHEMGLLPGNTLMDENATANA